MISNTYSYQIHCDQIKTSMQQCRSINQNNINLI